MNATATEATTKIEEDHKDAEWNATIETIACALADLIETHEKAEWPPSAVVAACLRIAAIVTAREGANPLRIAAHFCRFLDRAVAQHTNETITDLLGQIMLASIPSDQIPQA